MGRIWERNEKELEGETKQKSRKKRENKGERERESKEGNMNSLYHSNVHFSTY